MRLCISYSQSFQLFGFISFLPIILASFTYLHYFHLFQQFYVFQSFQIASIILIIHIQVKYSNNPIILVIHFHKTWGLPIPSQLLNQPRCYKSVNGHTTRAQLRLHEYKIIAYKIHFFATFGAFSPGGVSFSPGRVSYSPALRSQLSCNPVESRRSERTSHVHVRMHTCTHIRTHAHHRIHARAHTYTAHFVMAAFPALHTPLSSGYVHRSNTSKWQCSPALPFDSESERE